jgi:Ferritin-like domain
MKKSGSGVKSPTNRRAFLKHGMLAASVLGVPGALRGQNLPLFTSSAALTQGDADILRFLSAAEQIESDLWVQYNELGGVVDSEVPGGTGNEQYTAAIEALDDDMPQYIHDNTDDEISHFKFINAYLTSKGATPVNLGPFRTLPSSKANGARQIGRLTNLMQLTIDTSFYTRYRSDAHNPDLDPNFVFPQAVPGLAVGQHPAIPRDNSDLTPKAHIQAIANTAAFHFAVIEQGGTSLYAQLAQRVTDVEVLRVLLSIGGTEIAHFQIWTDKAGAAVSDPIAPLTDPKNPSLVFSDLNAPPFGGDDFETDLIFPEPVAFLNRQLPPCSIIRPTETHGAATNALNSLTADGLFIGQSPAFFTLMTQLATAADAATRV